MNLKDKIAVVVGATGGIGRALVRELDKSGMQCVLVGRNKEKLDKLQGELSNKSTIYVVDCCGFGSVQTTTQKIANDFPAIDLLVNAAGHGVYKPIEEVTQEDWEKSFAIGVTTPYFVTKLLLPSLKNSEEALVVNIGSGSGVIPIAGRSVYNVQKFALRGMTLSLAKEFKGSKIKIVLMTLGSVLTDFGPEGLEKRKKKMEAGKAYLMSESVAVKITDILESEECEVEYEIYPGNYEKDF